MFLVGRDLLDETQRIETLQEERRLIIGMGISSSSAGQISRALSTNVLTSFSARSAPIRVDRRGKGALTQIW